MSLSVKRPTRSKTSPADAKRGRPAPAAVASRVIREETPGSHLPAGATRTPGAPPASSEKRGKYVYCIVRADEALRFGPIGFGSPPGEVYTVLYEDIAAGGADAPREGLDPPPGNGRAPR